MSFLTQVDTSFLDGFDIEAFQQEVKVDELVIDLMNYIRNVDYCDAVRLVQTTDSSGLPAPNTSNASESSC